MRMRCHFIPRKQALNAKRCWFFAGEDDSLQYIICRLSFYGIHGQANTNNTDNIYQKCSFYYYRYSILYYRPGNIQQCQKVMAVIVLEVNETFAFNLNTKPLETNNMKNSQYFLLIRHYVTYQNTVYFKSV